MKPDQVVAIVAAQLLAADRAKPRDIAIEPSRTPRQMTHDEAVAEARKLCEAAYQGSPRMETK